MILEIIRQPFSFVFLGHGFTRILTDFHRLLFTSYIIIILVNPSVLSRVSPCSSVAEIRTAVNKSVLILVFLICGIINLISNHDNRKTRL